MVKLIKIGRIEISKDTTESENIRTDIDILLHTVAKNLKTYIWWVSRRQINYSLNHDLIAISRIKKMVRRSIKKIW